MIRVVLITGVSGGIGRATATVFLDDGWEVIGVDKQAMGQSDKIHFIKGDISDPVSAVGIFKEAARLVSGLDALVNNAAVQLCKPLVEMEADEWDGIMASNLRSVFLCVRHAYPLLRKPGGSIVNVSSVHAVATSANISAYAASKGAVLALTRALAIELAGDGIRVNAVLPGAVDTSMLRSGLERGHLQGDDVNEKLKSLGQRTPMGCVGRPEEIAQSILFLADNNRSSFITGQALVADGGALAKLSTE